MHECMQYVQSLSDVDTRPTGALEQYDTVLRINPEHWVALNNRAVMTMYDCRLAPALQNVEAAFVEAPWALLQVRVCLVHSHTLSGLAIPDTPGCTTPFVHWPYSIYNVAYILPASGTPAAQYEFHV